MSNVSVPFPERSVGTLIWKGLLPNLQGVSLEVARVSHRTTGMGQFEIQARLTRKVLRPKRDYLVAGKSDNLF